MSRRARALIAAGVVLVVALGVYLGVTLTYTVEYGSLGRD